MSERTVTVTARPSQRDLARMAKTSCDDLKETDHPVPIWRRDPRMAIELARHSARVLAQIADEEGR